LVLTGCGGAGGSSSPQHPAPVLPVGGAQVQGAVTLAFSAPTASSSAHRLAPAFVSANAASLGIAINGGTTAYADVSTSSPNCMTSSNGRSCTIPVAAPAGTAAFAFTLFDAANGGGKQIAIGVGQANVTIGQAFTVSATMEPIVLAFTGGSILYTSGSSFTVGTASSASVTLVATDPDGVTIPSTTPAFAQPVSLISSDPNITVTPSSWTSPGQAVTLAYNGSTAVGATVRLTINVGTATLLSLPVALSSSSPFSEFTLTTASGLAQAIVTGADGNLWFTEQHGNNIGRITPAGVITEFPIPTVNCAPIGIAAGPDGALWFTESNTSANKIGRITTAGVVTNEYTVPTSFVMPFNITAGPDGAMWFTEYDGDAIGRITMSGTITEYAITGLLNTAAPYGITAGPDGALWFTESNAATNVPGIGRVTTGGAFSHFTIPTAGSGSEGITSGPDGAIWFVEHASAANRIGRVTTAGVFSEYPIPTSLALPVGIAAGYDGALWFTEIVSGKIGRITTSGTITEFAIPSTGPEPASITAGPDNALWFTEQNTTGKIGRVH
jgi:virginiamycin B lyase